MVLRRLRPASITAAVALIGMALVVYYCRNPVITTSDTPSFRASASRILHGNPFDQVRTPGYPVMLAATGRSNQVATLLQGALFALCVAAVWFLGYRIVGRWWGGAIPAVFFAVDPYTLAYARTVGAEALAMFLLLAVACVGVGFATRRIALGAVTVCWLAFTKLEFAALPLVLLAVVVCSRPGRGIVVRAAVAVLGIYVLLGCYVVGNAIVNDYAGISVVSPINCLGKVIQYRMQSKAPAEYARITRKIDAYLATEGNQGPYAYARFDPEISQDNWRLAGEYAHAAIRNAPAEFAEKTLRLMRPEAPVALLALAWIVVWARCGARFAPIGLVSLLLLYDLLVTAVGGYSAYDRLQVVSYSMRVLVLTSTPVVAAHVVARRRVGVVPSTPAG